MDWHQLNSIMPVIYSLIVCIYNIKYSQSISANMKVLHVHNIAHIPGLMVRELRKRGIEADFVEDVRTLDMSNYDIVHAHYALNKATIRAFLKARKLKIPFILHCHGSDLRLVSASGRKDLPAFHAAISRYIRKRSSKIFLSTPDLIEYEPDGEYVPNPVDLEKFRPLPNIEKSDNALICGRFLKGSKVYEHIKPDREYDCVTTVNEIEWPDNVKRLPYVDYDELPAFFNRYEEMIGTLCDLISMARMEAMACGVRTFTDFETDFLKYYNDENPDLAEDPREFVIRHHHPDICMKRIVEVYNELMK